MHGIPPDLNRRLHKVLADCGPFQSDIELSAVFVDARINQWEKYAPSGEDVETRIKRTIKALYKRHNIQGENALVLFLEVLRDHPGPATKCDLDLDGLARDLTDVLAQETSPTPTPPAHTPSVIDGGAEVREFDDDRATDTLEPSLDVEAKEDETHRQSQESEKQEIKTKEGGEETTGKDQPIPLRTWELLVYIGIDLCMIGFWVWCSVRRNANPLHYLPIAGVLIGAYVLLVTVLIKRSVIPEKTLRCLGTSLQWLWVVICLTLVCVVVSAFFWPLGFIGKCCSRLPQLPSTHYHEIKIEAGYFSMGSDDEYPNSAPQHQVFVDAFWIDKYEVTNAEYKEFVDATNHRVPYVSGEPDWSVKFNWSLTSRIYPPGRENHPVVLVSWDDAQAYCQWRGKRLPTEAEWEKAARGIDGRRYPWGDDWPPGDSPKANTTEVRGDTAQVGTYIGDASPAGIMDMCGNVAEWVADKYQPYPGSPAWLGSFDENHMAVRGGSWKSPGKSESDANNPSPVDWGFATTAFRWGSPSDELQTTIGFRCAK